MEIRTSSNVVAFKLLSGAELIGKRVEVKNHPNFIDGEDVIYLDDALLIGVQQDDEGKAKLALGPLSGIGDGTEIGAMPFALYRSVVIGQVPVEPEVERLYVQRTSSIILSR